MKGFIHTIEVVIAIVMLLIAVTTIFSNPPAADTQTALLVEKGYSALQYLEQTGQLRQAASTHNVATINTALQPLLKTNFEVEICDPDCNGTSQQNVVAINYFIAGYLSYQPTHLKLYLW